MATPALEKVLEAEHARVDALRSCGHAREADNIARILRDVENATVDLRRWLSEAEAMLRSSRSREWLRANFAVWSQAGHARQHPTRKRERQYRQIVIPLRANAGAAEEAGRRGERFGT